MISFPLVIAVAILGLTALIFTAQIPKMKRQRVAVRVKNKNLRKIIH